MSTDGSILLVRLTAAAACVFGVLVVVWQFVRDLVVLPGTAALACAAELPLLIAGFCLLRTLRPVHPPALVWSAAAVIWGATAAVGCALLANQGLGSLWAKATAPAFASTWSASLSAPLNEELLKLCGVVLVVLAASQMIRGPLDGMIVGALTGVGFQAAENVTYGLNAVVMTGATDPDRAVLVSVLYRVGAGGLGSHWAMTAVAGAGVGYLVRRGQDGVLTAVCCLLVAIAMHLLFDAPYLGLLVKVGVNLAVVTGLYLVLRADYTRRARAVLADLADAGAVANTEAADVTTRRGRRRAARHARPGTERDHVRARQREILARIDTAAA